MNKMITMEPVTPQNVMHFKEVRLRALQDTPSAFGSTYAKEVQFTDDEWMARTVRWSGERAAGYLAMDVGIPCGIAGAYLDEEDASIAHLISMWVAPTHRRLGVGRVLIETVLTWAKTRNAHTLSLLVTSNNDSAIRFYERLGFSMTGKTESYPNDPALSEYEMARPIP